MKKLMLIACIALSNVIQAQIIKERLDEDGIISLQTSNVILSVGEKFSYANAGVVISKDTLADIIYVFSLCYKTPVECVLDSNAVVHIGFSNGDLLSYNYCRDKKLFIQKDSIVKFNFLPSFNFLNTMTNNTVSEISFTSPNYSHRIDIVEDMQLQLPKLSNLLLANCLTEYNSILKTARSVEDDTVVVFNANGNKKLDKKFYGKYSGEWNCDSILYNFDLYIKSDTSYIDWFVINDPNLSNPKAIQTQVLNVRHVTKYNNLIFDVCYEPDKAEYTNGSRWYMLNLSQNGKVLYGLSVELDKYYGEMYGVRKKRYKK
jgi:hypothetical protein